MGIVCNERALRICVSAGVLIAGIGLAGALALAQPESAFAATSSNSVKVSGTYAKTSAKAVLKKINAKRVKAKAKKLVIDKNLQKAAYTLAAEQAVYYGTTRPSGKNWTSAVKSSYRSGATLRRVGTYAVTQGQAVSALYKKADKKKRSVGIACFETEGQRYWVMICSSHKAQKSSIKSGTQKKTATVSTKSWMLGDIEIEKSKSIPALVYLNDVTLSCRITNKGAKNGASFVAQNAVFTSSDPSILQVEGKVARSVGSGKAAVYCSVAGKNAIWETTCAINVSKGTVWEIADNPEMVGSYTIDSNEGFGFYLPPTQRFAYCRYTTYIEYDGVRTYGKTTDIFLVENDAYIGDKQELGAGEHAAF